MRKADKTPEGQPVDHAPEVDSERAASLTRATEVSMLKPLGQQNDLLTFLLGYQSLWHVRLLSAGVGTLAMMALVVVSAIVIGINDPLPGPHVAMNESTDIEQTGPITFDIFSPPILSTAAPSLEPAGAHLRSKPAGPEVRLVTYKPVREPRSSSRLRIQKFAPTTLVISAENGVIKRRIEPWLTGQKSVRTINNLVNKKRSSEKQVLRTESAS